MTLQQPPLNGLIFCIPAESWRTKTLGSHSSMLEVTQRNVCWFPRPCTAVLLRRRSSAAVAASCGRSYCFSRSKQTGQESGPRTVVRGGEDALGVAWGAWIAVTTGRRNSSQYRNSPPAVLRLFVVSTA